MNTGIVAFVQNDGGTGGDDVNLGEGMDAGNFNFETLTLDGGVFGTGGTGATYTFTVDGTFDVAGDLALDFTIDNGVDSQQMSGAVLDSDLTQVGRFGNYFGLAGDAQNSGVDAVIDFDTYSVSVIPEPSAFALIAGGLVGMAVLRRRRS